MLIARWVVGWGWGPLLVGEMVFDGTMDLARLLDDFGGVAVGHRAGGDVPGDEASGSDHGAFADGDVGQDRDVAADLGALLDRGTLHAGQGVRGAGVGVVGHDHARRQEHVVLEGGPLRDVAVAMDLDVVPDAAGEGATVTSP